MSILRRGDEKFHYSDGSHKWIPPDPDYDQQVWDEQVRQHKQQHANYQPKVRIQRRVGASSTAANYGNRASRTSPRRA
jgi:hypothetical protein